MFVAVFVAVGVLAACAENPTATPATVSGDPLASEPPAPSWPLPPTAGYFDYQLSGDYPPSPSVSVLTRDWFAGSPVAGLYNICYINAFQTQPPTDDVRPDERDGWPAEVVSTFEDPEWPGEFVIDLGTPSLRATAAAFAEQMIDTCMQKGFDAVEFDNLDSYTRFDGLPFGAAEALAYAASLTRYAHDLGLAVGQKNTVELTREQSLDQVGFDFAVVEECAEFDECRSYETTFGLRVLSIEYTSEGMIAACEQFGGELPVLRRDRELVTPADPGYQFEAFCGFRGAG